MRWLKRLQATKMNPLGPEIISAPKVSFSLSGHVITIPCPPHEMIAPLEKATEKLNIYNDTLFTPWKSKAGMSLRLLYTGWLYKYKPFGEGELGYLALSIRLHRRDPHFRSVDSLLASEDMEKWLLTYSTNLWGSLNRDLKENSGNKARPIIPEKDFWRFPKTGSDIKRHSINNINWFSYVVDKPQKAKERLWHTPITDDHELAFDFEAEPLGRDYYSEEHDLDGAIERTVKEFIDNVHITFG
ncbi:hypothetical protein EUZ85_19920 [Hahella sp. KA22]|uniref:hypothetical protein n=1 Tax=Hahella sp. KA22 TaxID=1628392 RepID=UPI000FDDE1D7|nr:hypothetical protein [Hahella sp. KA22]AZZ92869.1 hypothetical protein ENC22_17340 [Hahella sp. KA22]QAY56243.1 hypothetical protein EUZ85_19920 [Hahella sp. KA22]